MRFNRLQERIGIGIDVPEHSTYHTPQRRPKPILAPQRTILGGPEKYSCASETARTSSFLWVVRWNATRRGSSSWSIDHAHGTATLHSYAAATLNFDVACQSRHKSHPNILLILKSKKGDKVNQRWSSLRTSTSDRYEIDFEWIGEVESWTLIDDQLIAISILLNFFPRSEHGCNILTGRWQLQGQ